MRHHLYSLLLCLLLATATLNAHAAVYSALGASDAVGIGALSPTDGYVPQISGWLNANYGAWTLRNHGVTTYTTVDIRDNTLQAAIADRPTVVTVWVGGNDVTHSVLRGEPTAQLQGYFQDAYSTIIRRLRTETSAVIVTANIPDISRLPIAGLVSSEQRQVAHDDSLAVNAIVAQVNATYGVPTVDLYSDPASYDSSNIFWDGFHPNNHGYALLAQKFEAVLGPMLSGHSLRGRISDTAGAATAGVTVRITHNGAATDVTTDRNGVFILPGVGLGTATNGIYTLTPHGGGYTFTPVSRTVDIDNAGASGLDFTVPLNLNLSGTVTGAGPLANVPVFLFNATRLGTLAAVLVNSGVVSNSDGVVARTRTDAAGHYTFSVSPGTYTVMPLLAGTVFSPVLRGPLVVTTASSGGQDFTASTPNRVGPSVVVIRVSASLVTGVATDRGAGILTVVATLQNSANAYLNWQSPNSNLQFTPAPVAASYRLATLPGTTTPLVNPSLAPIMPWTVALPRDLPPGTYRLTVRAINRAARMSAPVSVTVTKGSVAMPVVQVSSAVASSSASRVLLRLSGTVGLDNVGDPTRYRVAANGHAVAVEAALYNAASNTLELDLPAGALHAGDAVSVSGAVQATCVAGR